MKSKIIIVALMVVVVLFCCQSPVFADNVRDIQRKEDSSILLSTSAESASVESGEESTEMKSSVEETAPPSSSSDKEVHKRGVFYAGGLGHSLIPPHVHAHVPFATANANALWPKAYASPYGYSLGVPAATTFGLGHAPTILKVPQFASASFPTAFHYKAIAAPAAVPHLHPLHTHVPAVATTTTAAATPYVLRPGGALVSSYNVNYPRYYQKPAVAVQTVPAFQPAVQTTFVQTAQASVPAIPALPALPPAPPVPAVPAIPSIPTIPAVPSFTVAHAAPSLPAIPSFTAAAAPAFQGIPSVASIPFVQAAPAPPPSTSFQAVSPINQLFPIAFQPPYPQAPPTFVTASPTPSFVSVTAQPAPPSPPFQPQPQPQPVQPAVDSGSAIASPQIPAPLQPAQPAQPLPEAPAQQPWRPVYSRPAVTLLPPYGSGTPGTAYLPPPAEQLTDGHVYDGLSQAEIEQIFAQTDLGGGGSSHHHHHHHSHPQVAAYTHHHHRHF